IRANPGSIENGQVFGESRLDLRRRNRRLRSREVRNQARSKLLAVSRFETGDLGQRLFHVRKWPIAGVKQSQPKVKHHDSNHSVDLLVESFCSVAYRALWLALALN